MACVSAAERKNVACEHGAAASQVWYGMGLPSLMAGDASSRGIFVKGSAQFGVEGPPEAKWSKRCTGSVAAMSRMEGSGLWASMLPAAAASMREGLKRGWSLGTGCEDERARLVAAQSFMKVRTAAASASEWTMPTATAMPPSMKVVNWTFMDGRPLPLLES